MYFKHIFKQIKNFHYWLRSMAPMDPPWDYAGFEGLLKIHYLCTIGRKYRVIVVRCGFEFGAFLAIHPCKLPNACQQRQDGPPLLLTYRDGLKSGPQVASIFPAS